MTDLVMISLFDGIGGFPLAAQMNGIKTAVVVEIDKAAAGVTADHFPDAIHFSDITEVTGDGLVKALIAAGVDLSTVRVVLSGGWPCQDLSLAGRRLGLGGARSGLFFEIVRLIKELEAVGVQFKRDLRPRWLVLENVPGLLSACCSCPGLGRCAGGCTDPHPVPGGDCGRRRGRRGLVGRGRCMELHGGAMGAVLGSLVELGYGVAYRVLDAQHFGVPQRRRRVVIVGHLGDDGGAPAQVLLEPEGGQRNHGAGGAARAGSTNGAAVSTLQGGGKRGYRVDAESAAGGHLVPHVLQATGVDFAQITSAVNRSNPQAGDPQPPLTAAGQPAAVLRGRRRHEFTAERANGGEDGTGQGTPIVAFGFTESGNSFAGSEERTPSIRVGNGMGTAGAMMQQEAVVRRLTPVECERLQGYPDGWTLTSNGRKQADSARYRQLGNSIAVPVFAWVTARLVAYEDGKL